MRKYKKRKQSKHFVKFINLKNLPLKKCLYILELIILLYVIVSLVLSFKSCEKKPKSLDITTESDSKTLLNSSDTLNIINDTTLLSSDDLEILSNANANSIDTNILLYDSLDLDNKDNILSMFYTVDSKTGINYDLFDFNKFATTDFSLAKSNYDEPKILIFHTHGSEVYSDSTNLDEGVIGLGNLLEEEFENTYGIQTLHVTERFDIVNGQTQILGAYERMNVYISKIIEQYPSIELILDVHRDGLPEGVKHVRTLDGENVAPIMFVNGLSSLKSGNGYENLSNLPNPYIEENLAFSFQTNIYGNALYPDLFKKTYLHAYRYSLHYVGKSLLVEIGAQTNTWSEAKNAVKPLAKTITNVLK
ncbi:MAG: stage II sporulation protein P [Lachnospirales bacterium]